MGIHPLHACHLNDIINSPGSLNSHSLGGFQPNRFGGLLTSRMSAEAKSIEKLREGLSGSIKDQISSYSSKNKSPKKFFKYSLGNIVDSCSALMS